MLAARERAGSYRPSLAFGSVIGKPVSAALSSRQYRALDIDAFVQKLHIHDRVAVGRRWGFTVHNPHSRCHH